MAMNEMILENLWIMQSKPVLIYTGSGLVLLRQKWSGDFGNQGSHIIFAAFVRDSVLLLQ